MKLYNILLLLISAITHALVVQFIKYYDEKNNIKWLFYTLGCYIIAIIAYLILLKENDILIIYPISKILSIICAVIIGIVLFKEELTLTTIIALLLGIISVILLSFRLI
jgi:multidrug transporter EmrE-like cation transporter